MHLVIKFVIPISIFCVCLSILSCRPPRITLDPVALEESIFGCGEYEILITNSVLNHYSAIGSFGDFLAAVREDTLYIKSGVRNSPITKYALRVKSMISMPEKLLIAAEEGIYQLNDDLSLQLLLDREVTDIAMGPEDELLFIDDKAAPYRVYALDPMTQEVLPYTVAYESNLGAVPEELIVSEEGSIWIRNQQNNLIRYITPDSFFVYEGDNAVVPYLEEFTSMTMLDSPDGLMVWLKLEDRFVFLYQFVDDTWTQLYTSDERITGGLDALIRFAEPNNMLLLDKTLYLSADHGVIRFQLAESNTVVTDYSLINDPAFAWPAIENLHSKEENLYYLLNRERLVEIDCR